MKTKPSKPLIILGFIALPLGILLIVLACTVWSYYPFGNSWFGKTPLEGALIPGIFLCFISLPLLVTGFLNPTKRYGSIIKSPFTALKQMLNNTNPNPVQPEQPAVKQQVDKAPKIYRCPGCNAALDKNKNQCDFCGTKF